MRGRGHLSRRLGVTGYLEAGTRWGTQGRPSRGSRHPGPCAAVQPSVYLGTGLLQARHGGHTDRPASPPSYPLLPFSSSSSSSPSKRPSTTNAEYAAGALNAEQTPKGPAETRSPHLHMMSPRHSHPPRGGDGKDGGSIDGVPPRCSSEAGVGELRGSGGRESPGQD